MIAGIVASYFETLPTPLQTLLSDTLRSANVELLAGRKQARGTITDEGGTVLSERAMSEGRFYAEVELIVLGGFGQAIGAGLHLGTANLDTYIGGDADGWSSFVIGAAGNTRVNFHNGTIYNSTVVGTPAIGARMRLAVDIDAGRLWLSHWGSSSWIGGGDPAAGTSPTFAIPAGASYRLALCPRARTNVLALVDPGAWASAAPSGYGIWSP